jgi:hypothetical protein
VALIDQQHGRQPRQAQGTGVGQEGVDVRPLALLP